MFSRNRTIPYNGIYIFRVIFCDLGLTLNVSDMNIILSQADNCTIVLGAKWENISYSQSSSSRDFSFQINSSYRIFKINCSYIPNVIPVKDGLSFDGKTWHVQGRMRQLVFLPRHFPSLCSSFAPSGHVFYLIPVIPHSQLTENYNLMYGLLARWEFACLAKMSLTRYYYAR